MMQAEFETLIGKKVDYAVYSELVEPVYMYHPGITCKTDIAAIYKLPRGVDILRSLLLADEFRQHGRRGQQAARADRPTDGQARRHPAATEAAFE